LEKIHIVVSTNDNYAKHLAVMLTSLFENKKSKNPVMIHVIDGNLSKDNKSKLRHSIKKYHTEIKFLKVNEDLYKNVKIRFHLSKETYYRISIPDLLDKDIDKALYLDCDIILKEDITKLWNVDIRKHHAGAVQIPGHLNRYEELSIPESAGYFNAGVLLLNLKKWRRDKTSSKVLHYMNHHMEKLKLMDQDALNVNLRGKWLKLDPRWNYQVHRHRHQNFKPWLIHYTTRSKPWSGNPRFKDEYFHYLRRTKWD
jgi:lipopolysaccharide biosynthesis glycosyltransferase